jgi:hypothetical protein
MDNSVGGFKWSKGNLRRLHLGNRLLYLSVIICAIQRIERMAPKKSDDPSGRRHVFQPEAAWAPLLSSSPCGLHLSLRVSESFEIARFQEVADEDLKDIVERIFKPSPVAT